MKRTALIIVVLVLSFYMFGCGKKKQPLEEMQEPVSMEAIGNISAETQAAPQNQPQEIPSVSNVPEKVEQLPPAGPYKPTVKEIQTALKNAGYYTGAVDGKSGPMTKKAVEEFQKANGLQVDGKVGLKTWVLLSTHLKPAAAPSTKQKE